MIYSYRNFPFGEMVTGERNANAGVARSQMAWVLNNKVGISYIGRAVGGGNAKKPVKASARVPEYVAQAV